MEGGGSMGGDAVCMHVERGNKVEGDAVYFVRMRGEQDKIGRGKKGKHGIMDISLF